MTRESWRGRTTPVVVHAMGPSGTTERPDLLAVEEPLSIRLAARGGDVVDLVTTMRTPGDDFELAVGWLAAEGVVVTRRDVLDVSWCVTGEAQRRNAVTVTLAVDRLPDLGHLDRRGVMTSACGVCGRASLEALEDRGLTPLGAGSGAGWVDLAALGRMPATLRAAQDGFDATGGLHAAARFTTSGDLIALREDVGRHNALDKLVGAALLDDDLPWSDSVLVLSGRASYELLAKAVVARVPVVAAIGAPSSLAVDVAATFGITLAGFLRRDQVNVYTGTGRIRTAPALAERASVR
jgi:FdhD protein